MTLNTEWAVKTDIGKKYKHNEDFFFLPVPDSKFGITDSKIAEKGKLFIVCDGMGGAKSGEVASQLTAGWVAKGFYDYETVKEPSEILKQIITEVNAKIYNLAKEHEQYEGMCTTIVCVHLSVNELVICSLGDSRAYLLRESKLDQLTEDHSTIWPLYKSGDITKEDLRHHPRNHVLTHAIGGEAEVDRQDLFCSKEIVKSGDILLLCSDGLSDMLSDEEIETILKEKINIEQKAEKLIEKANENGGKDNITVMLLCVS